MTEPTSVPMDLAAEVRQLCLQLPARLPPFDVASARVGHLAGTRSLGGEPLAVDRVDGFTVAPDERWATPRLAVRRYRPTASARAAIVWLHGGGWVTGSFDSFDPLARALALATGRQVLLVDYRLAPEARFPAAIADSVAAYLDIVARAGQLGIDTRRIALGGDSAGAHLAIAAARWLRREGLPQPKAQLLAYPVTDARMRSASFQRYAEGYQLSAALMAWFWCQFLPEGSRADGRAVAIDDPDVSPVLAPDLAGLPPTWVMTAECDILRDEGVALFAALRRAGVAAEHHEVPRMIHGFLRMLAPLPQAEATLAALAGWLDRELPPR